MTDPLDDPDHLLAAARQTIAGTLPGWPRTAALLARIALENAVAATLSTRHQRLDGASMRSQLLLLPTVTDKRTSHHAQTAWAGLSRACHQHPYEMAPTLGEVNTLIDAVNEVVVGLDKTRSQRRLTPEDAQDGPPVRRPARGYGQR